MIETLLPIVTLKSTRSITLVIVAAPEAGLAGGQHSWQPRSGLVLLLLPAAAAAHPDPWLPSLLHTCMHARN